ncbi:type II toxin-antitoxin system RelE/ParE family toxin [Tenacibaculum halocynthiae]|uniref:type II toxin-antitoxin system RelE/ParE family toxin n=1 Tax=Tenacibaculum halocynthiae TaxID=1254437 RepID=UPI003D64E0C2
MSYKIKYSKEAISELNKGVVWYRSKELDLGQRFKDAFHKIRIQLKENPEIFKEVGTNHRRAVLGSSFPYTIHYSINEKNKTVRIIGVIHQSQNLELVKEQIKLRKIHELKHEEIQRFEKRKNQLKNLRQRQELEQDIGRERDRGLEL